MPEFVSSPCVGTCRIDDSSGLCIGCARTRTEIRDWREADPDSRRRIWADLASRRTRIGIGLHRLDWTPDDVRSFIMSTLQPNVGTWVSGIFGAIAEFCVGPNESVTQTIDASSIAAWTGRGAIRFKIPDDVRAMALSNGESSRSGIMILASPRSRIVPNIPSGLAALGSDREAIHPAGLNQQLYDLGIGSTVVRFCIRTGDVDLIQELEAYSGRGWSELLTGLGKRILHASPTRVISSPLGRLEILTPIPPPDGRSPHGPHTHLLPAQLASGRETPPGIDLPETLTASAIFYPGPTAPDSETCH